MLHIFVFLVLIAIIAPALVIVPQSFTSRLPDKGILPQVVPEVLREPRVDHLA